MSRKSLKRKPNLLVAILPLVVFLALAMVFYSLLSPDRNPGELPSALLDQPAPNLLIPPLEGLEHEGVQVAGLGADVFSGKISVVNFFASWCVPCRQEHPQMLELAKDKRFQMIGINQKDNRKNALSFLNELENPYDLVGVDRQGRASIEWGVYGIPETFLVDDKGRIFHKHIGPISIEILQNQIIPLLESKL